MAPLWDTHLARTSGTFEILRIKSFSALCLWTRRERVARSLWYNILSLSLFTQKVYSLPSTHECVLRRDFQSHLYLTDIMCFYTKLIYKWHRCGKFYSHECYVTFVRSLEWRNVNGKSMFYLLNAGKFTHINEIAFNPKIHLIYLETRNSFRFFK